jgi:tRNA-splicing ligase RtcB (3'-phosphate/5'-hydroxy nucleic acid ligase)
MPQMNGLELSNLVDSRLAGHLRDEAPAAYKEIPAVLRAQKDMVKVIRTLRPVLNYKAV